MFKTFALGFITGAAITAIIKFGLPHDEELMQWRMPPLVEDVELVAEYPGGRLMFRGDIVEQSVYPEPPPPPINIPKTMGQR